MAAQAGFQPVGPRLRGRHFHPPSELRSYPAPASVRPRPPAADWAGVFVPLQLVTEAGILSFFSTTTVFGTPVDITLSELAVEAFFPSDSQTAEALRSPPSQTG